MKRLPDNHPIVAARAERAKQAIVRGDEAYEIADDCTCGRTKAVWEHAGWLRRNIAQRYLKRIYTDRLPNRDRGVTRQECSKRRLAAVKAARRENIFVALFGTSGRFKCRVANLREGQLVRLKTHIENTYQEGP